jgi:indole-3-glycerol phosphate synthase
VSRSIVRLDEIVARTREEVEARKAFVPLHEIQAKAFAAPRPRNFFAAVTRAGPGSISIIAEIKRRSPSAGLIRPEYDGAGFRPEDIARAYQAAGAAAISCLTNAPYFAGELSYIARIKRVVSIPVLRKDFIVDPWQVYESRAAGADAILLIAECLNDSEIVDLHILAHQLGLTTLLEVHSVENLLRVRPYLSFPHPAYALLGINNRDLNSMSTDVSHTLRLLDMVDDRSTFVSESGISSVADLRRLRDAGVRIALIGEYLMRQPDPGEALRSLLAGLATEGKNPA